MAGIFQFKQFAVDQTGCAMKINTDGVLLGALAEAKSPQNILDIGTGTGVIALMLAQRFSSSKIDAVEIDESASLTATKNFKNSPFADRLKLFHQDFEKYFEEHPERKYDLIVSNPPFHINSLESPKANKKVAKHTDKDFFEGLITGITKHLTESGLCWLILPISTAELVKELAASDGLFLQRKITIHSFEEDIPHREILVLGTNNIKLNDSKFVIYKEPKVYSEMYIAALKDFFTIF
ncbi:tRNA1(Val) (adenine(37)-N6)-methyltransferase [Mucilaginibacter sp. L196]|uniref:tRNA1(Val) (adenine(37)-N6)-methyltransferase n=1 Tax=Mucilaginibacter sp. L196 TaxID=1641870 RepID=UPI00131C27CA|nr:methyltransferase [Mucilaginibacter sp. L196]